MNQAVIARKIAPAARRPYEYTITNLSAPFHDKMSYRSCYSLGSKVASEHNRISKMVCSIKPSASFAIYKGSE